MCYNILLAKVLLAVPHGEGYMKKTGRKTWNPDLHVTLSTVVVVIPTLISQIRRKKQVLEFQLPVFCNGKV